MKKPKKAFEPDPDIGRPCGICGAIYRYRVTLACPECGKKIVYECLSPAEAIAIEEQIAEGLVHQPCQVKMKARRWRTHEHHHISYRNDLTVLVCYLCHQRMHGNAAITHHPFKKEYAKDLEPFIFAAHVTALYVENLPELQGNGPAVDEDKDGLVVSPERKTNTTSH